MLSTYKTKDDFLGAVSSHLEKQESQANIRSALLTGISAAEDDLRNESREESQAFHLKLGSWVIRDDDIPIFESFNSMATAVALTLTTAGIAWPAVAAALTALANICWRVRSEEHTSELQSHVNLVCRLLLEKKNKSGDGVRRVAREEQMRTHVK